jgi:hypothetical protein
MVYYNTSGTICMPDDPTFYCRLSRFTGEVTMLLLLLFLIVFLYSFMTGKNMNQIFHKK